MSKQVDVLAVIRDAQNVMYQHGFGAIPDDMTYALAAIAELIEASKFALDKSWEYGADEPHFVKLNVAIDRCKGGAA